MRKSSFLVSVTLAAVSLVPMGFAQKNSELNNPLPQHMPTKARYVVEFAVGGSGGSLTYHGGSVMQTAYVVPIFWGPSFATGGSDAAAATSVIKYIAGGTTGNAVDKGFGVTGEYNVITQYSGIQQSNLGSAGSALYDNSTPPKNVTDSAVQSEVLKMTNNAPRTDTIYEVFLPSTSYSSYGSSNSCGGPNLQYCAYHGNFAASTGDVKYASMPYPSCGGCQTSGFSVTQNFEHFISHETREAVTDPDGTAWFDHRGYEADDKCAWSPTPFTDTSAGFNEDGTAFAYQYEWSNANSACVKSR